MNDEPRAYDAEAQLVADLLELIAEEQPLPPLDLRGRLIGGARMRRPAAPAYAEPYSAQVSVLDALLAELTEAQWGQRVIYDWSVRDLVEHLGAVDGVVEEFLHGRLNVSGQAELDRRTGAAQAAGRAPAETRAHWRAQSAALCTMLFDRPEDHPTDIVMPMPLHKLMIVRAFETWVHTSDIAAAVDRALAPPLPQHLHPIADMGVRLLPATLHAATQTGHSGQVDVTLAGPGGGRWIIDLAMTSHPEPAAAPVLSMELDVLDFCFLLADRRDHNDLEVAIHGDQALARTLLQSASAFAAP